jgi:hypothetical protein
MANALNEDLTDKVVIIGKEYLRPEFHHDRRFMCQDGFGCKPYTIGKAIFGYYLIDGEQDRIEGFMVESIADDDEQDEDAP